MIYQRVVVVLLMHLGLEVSQVIEKVIYRGESSKGSCIASALYSNIRHMNAQKMLLSATFISLTPEIANMPRAFCETLRCQQHAKHYD